MNRVSGAISQQLGVYVQLGVSDRVAKGQIPVTRVHHVTRESFLGVYNGVYNLIVYRAKKEKKYKRGYVGKDHREVRPGRTDLLSHRCFASGVRLERGNIVNNHADLFDIERKTRLNGNHGGGWKECSIYFVASQLSRNNDSIPI
ncbi:uncharacterized protein LOC143148455 isoform X1 [Ptiloglossa arizonensis]|uniref:uncharacterized protein LOC143148455 isoform X1 n=1 Tax=Ptiloglossa arizonensis TaxID=3350558 RepID=UPI003F9F06C9